MPDVSNARVPGWEDAAVVSGPHAVFPRRFGRYLLLRRLAHGGMGEVCVAKASGAAGIEKLCIVKTLRPDLTHDAEDVARFVDEARTVVQLGHRNICQVFDVGEVGGQYYIAMELVLGQNLRFLLDTAAERGTRMHPDVGIHVVAEVLEALDYAHGYTDPLTGKPLRVVHRDVSPQNVMVSHQGEVKLIDFGIAVSSVKRLKTDPSIILGKVAYLSHEQAVGGHVGAETDQYAAAVVCYELVVGERFYEGLDAQQMLDAAADGTYVPRRMEQLDVALQDVLRRALSPDPSARFPTCGHFREALLAYQHARGVRVDVKHVRQLMTDVFGDDQARLASELQRLASLPVEESARVQGGTEPTRTIAMKMRFDEGRAPGVDPLAGQTIDDAMLPAGLVAHESTQLVGRRATGEHRAPPPPSKKPLVLAAAGIVAALIVAAAVVSSVARGPKQPAVAVASPSAPAATVPPVEPPPPPSDAPTDAPTEATPPIPAPPAASPPPPTPATTTKEPDRGGGRRKPQPAPITRPKSTGSVAEKLAYLRAACPRQACARSVLARDDKLAGMSVDELKDFKRALDQCVAQCR